jgi:hypothetical protein
MSTEIGALLTQDRAAARDIGRFECWKQITLCASGFERKSPLHLK